MDNNFEFCQVGQYFTHFIADHERITVALINAGYSVCHTPTGDMIIMKPGIYNPDDRHEFNDDDDEDDFEDNIRHFPREY